MRDRDKKLRTPLLTMFNLLYEGKVHAALCAIIYLPISVNYVPLIVSRFLQTQSRN